MRILFALTVALLLAAHLPAPLALAAEPPTDPMLRIETGRHTASIRRIATDAGGHFLVTASHDKSLRVWAVPAPGSGEFRLLRTIRPPSGSGDEGKLYSVALSPDGGTVAAGGWTELGSDSGTTIYLFNRASGNLIARITGLPNVINHLTFSPDGRYLAASLGGKNGVRLYRTSDWSLAGEDREYGGQSYSAHFSQERRLVTTSYDGFVRLYDTASDGLSRIAKVKAPEGSRPFAARFSPDGGRVAIGYDDTTNLSVLSASDLALLFSPDTTGVTAGDLSKIAWSADGRTLFAGGRYQKQFDDTWRNVIRRWSDAGQGAYRDTAASDNNIMDLSPLPDGRLVYGSGEPAIGILDQKGARTPFAPPNIADFPPAGRNMFFLSPNGAQVGFGYEQWGKAPATFDLATRRLSLGENAALFTPLTSADGLSVTDWNGTMNPELNGTSLQLEQYEMSRSLAIAPGGSSFVLGTEWYLRRFDRSGKQLWEVPVPSTVWAVNVARNGAVVLAAYGDGTIRWHRMSDGRELLAFFPHADRERWVLWTPSGYYDASPGGEELIGWHVNNGRDQAADFFPASRFRESRYRPDVIARILADGDEATAIRLADAARTAPAVTAPIARLLPPVVRITAPAATVAAKETSLALRYTVRAPADAPATGIRVLIDGRPFTSFAAAPGEREQTVTVTIPPRDCKVSLVAENRHAASEPDTLAVTWQGEMAARSPVRMKTGKAETGQLLKPRLFLLAVGVSAYRDPNLALRYPAKDARDFAAVQKAQEGRLYGRVEVKSLPDATREQVLDGLEWLEKSVTGRDDVGMIFLAGHGVNDANGFYYFLPSDGRADRLKQSGLVFSDIINTLSVLKGNAVIFLDTCHSGNVSGTPRTAWDINKVINTLASPEHGVVVFASSSGSQLSYEDERWDNGAFTKALVEGLGGEADPYKDGMVTISTLEAYVNRKVKKLTGGRQQPNAQRSNLTGDFSLAVTVADAS